MTWFPLGLTHPTKFFNPTLVEREGPSRPNYVGRIFPAGRSEVTANCHLNPFSPVLPTDIKRLQLGGLESHNCLIRYDPHRQNFLTGSQRPESAAAEASLISFFYPSSGDQVVRQIRQDAAWRRQQSLRGRRQSPRKEKYRRSQLSSSRTPGSSTWPVGVTLGCAVLFFVCLAISMRRQSDDSFTIKPVRLADQEPYFSKSMARDNSAADTLFASPNMPEQELIEFPRSPFDRGLRMPTFESLKNAIPPIWFAKSAETGEEDDAAPTKYAYPAFGDDRPPTQMAANPQPSKSDRFPATQSPPVTTEKTSTVNPFQQRPSESAEQRGNQPDNVLEPEPDPEMDAGKSNDSVPLLPFTRKLMSSGSVRESGRQKSSRPSTTARSQRENMTSMVASGSSDSDDSPQPTPAERWDDPKPTPAPRQHQDDSRGTDTSLVSDQASGSSRSGLSARTMPDRAYPARTSMEELGAWDPLLTDPRYYRPDLPVPPTAAHSTTPRQAGKSFAR